MVRDNHATPSAPSIATVSSATVVSVGSEDGSFSFSELEGKNSVEQLEWLKEQLVRENRIKEGAENLLNMNLTVPQRAQVVSELDMAKEKIDAISKRIDIASSKSKPPKRKVKPAHGGSTSSMKTTEDISGEDFRKALQTGVSCIKELDDLARSDASPSISSVSRSPTGFQTAAVVESNNKRVELMGKLIQVLQKHLRVKYELIFGDILQAVLPCFADRCTKQCRAAAYRVIRHSLVDAESVAVLGNSVDWYIVKSLIRDNKHAVEKEQVIKLIRTIVDVGTVRKPADGSKSGPRSIPLSETVMRALMAVAEHAEDPFRLTCIQTLTEIMIIDIDLAFRTGTIRFLLHVLGEGPLELSPLLASVFLKIVDNPESRKYLRVGTDLEIALIALTDAYGKGPDHAERMRGCARVVQFMLRTWSGLMYFCMDDLRAIRSLVNILRIPSLETREIVLDMFFDLLNIKPPAWYKTFIDGRRLTMYRKSRDAPENQGRDLATYRPMPSFKLTDHYLALLVAIFTNAGLCEALTAMLEETTTGTNLSRKATLLMAEILSMANRVLPLSLAARIQAIPDVFCMATNYENGESRIIGSSALSAIDSFNRNRARLEPSGSGKNARARADSVDDAVRRGQRQVEQVKLKMSMQMDDRVFHASMLETQVIATKDHTKWNFETLQALIEGPLLNSKRLDEAIRISRFVRRLMTFFHPFSHRFTDLKRTRANTRWVRLGCSLLNTLMSSPDGVKYLATEDQFLPQIVKSFAQLDPFNGVPDSDPIFSKRRVQDTLTYGYLEMLGVLSKYKDGVELLEKFKVFTAFYHLSELRSREDLIKGIVENLDYSIDGHPRIVLSKALTSSYKHIRLYATNHLGTLIRGSANANAWTLRLLLTQLYDPAPEVCEMAVEFLEEACESKEILQLAVEMHPTMDHLGEIGQGLLLKFMSTPVGFRFLYDAGYIHREMEAWFNGRNIDYVIEVEVFLSKVFHFGHDQEEEEELVEFDGTVPSHFYGEMAKTELGCQVLQEKGHFTEFAEFIRQHNHESEDIDLISKLKSILWAVGHIGSTEGGLHFLEEEEIIPVILEIAEESPIPALRGTCFFILGLISSTSQGAEILDDFDWEATLSPLGMPVGICIPADIDKFISLPQWEPITPQLEQKRESILIPPTAEHEIEAITAIQNLANAVIANAASRSLARLKSRPETRGIFSSPEMLYRSLHLISTQRYRLPVRRYILELFTQEMDQDLIIALNSAAKRLKPSPSYKPPRTDTLRMSVFGGKSRRTESDLSDEDDEVRDTPPARVKPPEEQPKLTLQPLQKIEGFAA